MREVIQIMTHVPSQFSVPSSELNGPVLRHRFVLNLLAITALGGVSTQALSGLTSNSLALPFSFRAMKFKEEMRRLEHLDLRRGLPRRLTMSTRAIVRRRCTTSAVPLPQENGS